MINPNTAKKAVYLHQLQMRDGLYRYEGTTFTGIAFDRRAYRQVEAVVVERGLKVGFYQPKFLSPADYLEHVDYTIQVDFSKEFEQDDAGRRAADEAFVYQEVPFNGVAYYFKDSSEGELTQRKDYLFEEGKTRACLEWNAEGELVEAWYNRALPEGVGGCYTWDFRESEEFDAPLDGDLANARVGISKSPTLECPDSMDNFLNIEFIRNSHHTLDVISIVGDIALEHELTPESLIYWPFPRFEAVFSAWPASENLEVGGTAFDDTLFARFMAAADTQKVKSIDIFPVHITCASAELLLAMPALRSIRLGKGHNTDVLEMRNLVEKLRTARPALAIKSY